MRRLRWTDASAAQRAQALARPKRRSDPEIARVVRQIFDEVEQDGEAAVRCWSRAIDKREPERLALSSEVVDTARAALARDDLAALDTAVENVRRYHETTKPVASVHESAPGVRCTRLWRPIRSCGLYVPGGSAPLFSTLIMLAIPARVAGVPERIVVTPPRAECVAPIMIAAAAASGLEALYLLGGAQAIAALTFGAFTPRCTKLFGPGNAYVNEAKRFAAGLANGPSIDLPAGPSELMVIADHGADPSLVAADLLSQAEHDVDAQVVLAATSANVLDAVAREMARQVATLPRAEIAEAALANALLVEVRDVAEAADVANAYAPEHLALHVGGADTLLDRIENAGAVFVGRFSAETFGDYICGPSHVLPTDGAAAQWSGVTTASFMKSFVAQRLDEDGARALGPAAARLARLEGLEAHARAADARVR